MSIPHSLLAILSRRPAHGYGLKAGFERSTAGAWPLNVGQVYTTLARLERDGMVEAESPSEGPRQTWRVTEKGRAALDEWYAAPVIVEPPSRDEFAIKVLLAVAADHTDVTAVLQRQRAATMDLLQKYTRQKAAADPERELPFLLLVDALILKADAEIRWIDLCEARLREREGR